MRALLPDPAPADFQALLDRRRRLGVDGHDEVWKGVLHVNPAAHGRHAKVQAQLLWLLRRYADDAGLAVVGNFNLGAPEDYRIPDGGLLRPSADELYYPTAALAIEILSPGDETWDKLEFYAAHGVEELLIVDPANEWVRWFARIGGAYEPRPRSELVDLSVEDLARDLGWAPAG